MISNDSIATAALHLSAAAKLSTKWCTFVLRHAELMMTMRSLMIAIKLTLDKRQQTNSSLTLKRLPPSTHSAASTIAATLHNDGNYPSFFQQFRQFAMRYTKKERQKNKKKNKNA